MIPSNVDSRRPEKVQRYKPSQTNGNATGDDLTPDYMNILGPESTSANAESASEMSEEHRPVQESETVPPNAAVPISVVPTSSQYGIASLPPTTSNDIPSETITPATDTLTETTAKSVEGDNKDMHSTPSRNDRFKVVKIASLEPFRRGRWKCMDYVDQTAPVTTATTKVTQPTANMPIYMHTQSLPQQHLQQMLVQGAYSNPQFYQNLPSQMMPPNQYFYPAQAVPNIQTQTLPQQMGVTPNNVQPVYISTTQPYVQQNVLPNSIGFSVQGYPNVQYVPSNLIQNQGSAFIPTSQNVNSQVPANFQQSQTYAGQPTVSQSSVVQPMVNGHAFPQQNEQQAANSLPTQAAKNAILNSQGQNPVSQNIPIQNNQPTQIQAVPVQVVAPTQQFNQQMQNPNYQQVPQINQNNQQQINQVPQNINQVPVTNINQNPSSNPLQTTVPLSTVATAMNLIPTTVPQVNPVQPSVHINPIQSANMQNVTQMIPILQQCYDPMMPTSIYANPQFVANINSLPVECADGQAENAQEASGAVENSSDSANAQDPAKANPVVPQVNAIDNKIEQAMDLVKSHLMYTVREEVEILKEKITELMEKIQQLETENNYLKTQIPKNQNLNPSGTPDPPQ